MTSAEVRARTRDLLIPKIAARILAANTSDAAEALTREVVEMMAALGRRLADVTAQLQQFERRAVAGQKRITFEKSAAGDVTGAVIEGG
jgi:hypothetical protein